jgi:maleylacetate reductase
LDLDRSQGRRADDSAGIGASRPLILATPTHERARKLEDMLGERSDRVYAGAVMHTPTDVTAAVLRFVSETAANGIVALGGRSMTGLAKTIAFAD